MVGDDFSVIANAYSRIDPGNGHAVPNHGRDCGSHHYTDTISYHDANDHTNANANPGTRCSDSNPSTG